MGGRDRERERREGERSVEEGGERGRIERREGERGCWERERESK